MCARESMCVCMRCGGCPGIGCDFRRALSSGFALAPMVSRACFCCVVGGFVRCGVAAGAFRGVKGEDRGFCARVRAFVVVLVLFSILVCSHSPPQPPVQLHGVVLTFDRGPNDLLREGSQALMARVPKDQIVSITPRAATWAHWAYRFFFVHSCTNGPLR